MSMQNESVRKLRQNLTPAGAWAFALGTSIGWGSLVVTSNTYLAQAGPYGSVFGMIIGALIMLVISHSYAYLMNCYPESGGAYTYCKEAFGYDHGFLAAWFLSLTYLAMLWANATSLPLFARYFLGNIFEFGKMYTLFGYNIYFGEAILSISAILIAAFFTSRYKNIIAKLMIVMVVFFSLGISLCFFAALTKHGLTFTPAFVPGKNAFPQIIKIAVISPWAFIGFENISHGTAEFSFKHNQIHRILVVSVVTTTILYLFAILLSASAYPPQFANWWEYIGAHGSLEGIEALPAFYAANHYLGSFGVGILMVSLLSLIITSLFGNITALSRLIYALGKDRILPESFGELNQYEVPGKAILLIAITSLVIPFIGRTAIGWIVDVTTFGATLIYGFVSAAAMKTARFRNDKIEEKLGMAGVVIMIGFGIYLLVPNLFTTGSMEPESYFLFVTWSVLGFFVFRTVLKWDGRKRFGKSIIVWIALLSLILFISLVWMSQSIMNATAEGLRTVEQIYANSSLSEIESSLVTEQLNNIRMVSARCILVVVGMFALSLGVLLNNYNFMSRKAAHSEMQLGIVKDMANTDPLTGVKSKLAYAEKEAEINELIAKHEISPFAIAVCDVNGLKVINDTQGHKAGDEYIKSASRLICTHFEHSPVYRIGGDEFVAILMNHDYEQKDEILKAIHETSLQHIQTKEVVVSAGIASFHPESDVSIHTVFERADGRMYEEKKYLKSKGAAARI